MTDLTFRRALHLFYENLSTSTDHSYYENPVGLSRRHIVVRFCKQTMPNRILDLGCGDGNISRELLSIGDITSVDIAFKRALRAHKLGVKSICADALCLPFAEHSFDCVICSEVIEHVLNPVQLLLEIHKVLLPDRFLIITVPLENQGNYKTLRDVPVKELTRLKYGMLKQQYHLKNDHLSFFSEEKMQKMLQSCGFSIIAKDYTYEHELRSGFHSFVYSVVSRANLTAQLSKSDLWLRGLFNKTERIHHLIIKAIANH